MIKTMRMAAALLLAYAGTSMAAPVVLFSDDFDAETLGLDATPSQWTVTGGTVDIIGSGGSFDFLPGNGRYIDLDGSTGAAGTMTTLATFDLLPGYTYTLQFDLAGSQGGTTGGGAESDTVHMAFTAAVWGDFVVPKTQDFVTHTYIFSVGAPISGVQLSFQNTDGGDNIGPLLDNVLLTAEAVTPAPGAIVLGSLGVVLVGCLRRRRTL